MPQFVSSTGMIGDAVHDMLMERAQLQDRRRQQAVENARQAEQLRLQQEQDKRAAAAAVEAGKTADINRRAAEETLTRGQRTDVQKRLAETGMGAEVTGDLLTQAQKLTPESLKVTQSHEQNTLPASSVNMRTGESTPFSQATPFSVADKTTYAGTHEERGNRALATAIRGAKTRQEAVQAAVDAGTPANQIDDLVNTLFKSSGKTFLYRTSKGISTDPEGKIPFTGQYDPEKHQVEPLPAPPGAGGGQPFFIPITGAGGTTPFNGRTGMHLDANGQWTQAPIALRPTGAQAQDMVNNASAMTQIELIKGDFNPEWTGPAAGRIGSLYTAYANDAPGLARMQTRVSALKNRFIKAITGAQMSEPEATRIMKELPDMNLPPTTFMERLGVAEQNLGDIMDLQSQIYLGSRRPTGNPITEAQLNKLYPDEQFIGKGAKKTEAAPGAKPEAPKASKSKYQVTVN